MYRNVLVFYTNVENNQQFLRFSTFPVHSGTFLASKLIKNGPKMVENYENYTGIFDSYRKLSVFPVHFPEITRNPETVTETHGLSTHN